MADPHFWERGTLQPMRHGALEEPVKGGIGAGFPVLFSGGPLPELAGAPTLGMHNNEVYGRLLGLGKEELRRLKKEGIL
jgi:crotonobetainyl-CoA:carnitine CoA-transferase CaiB-like acyl-CoA transferase